MSGDVQRYFTERARSFDRLYDLPPVERVVNRLFRRAVYQRFALTFQHAGDVTAKRVLDIGCGSGRYAIEFARRGAAEVLGVDFSDEMLRLARDYAQVSGVADRVRFERGDFGAFETDQPFDIAIAIGFFDYIADPAPVLARVRAATSGRLLASFPVETFPRSSLRRRRYAGRGVHLRFYRREEIADLARIAGFASVSVLPLSAGHFLVADVAAGR